MKYRKELDGLRALAVLPVIFFHAGFQVFSGGFVGVDVFFVISGYLITSIIISEMQSEKFTLVGFYERRVRRILPALFFVMFVCCLAFNIFLYLPGETKEFMESILGVVTFTSNIYFWHTSNYFDTEAELKPLLHTWSLAVEEQYYLFFPIFLMLAWQFGKHWILICLIFVALASLAVAQWGSATYPVATFYLLPTRGWELLIGAFVAFYFSYDNRPRVGKLWLEVGGFIGLLFLLYAIFIFQKHTPFPSFYALIPTLGTALIILCSSQETLIGRLLGNKLLVGIGLMSYSAYLWHQPLFAFARLSLSKPSEYIFFVLSIATFVLAYFSWRYIEIPFRDKKQFTREKIFKYGAWSSAAFIVLGLIGNATTGFLFIYGKEDQYLASIQNRKMGEYVNQRFNSLQKESFVDDKRMKVLIIGDSFGQDLVNALYESNLSKDIQIVTRKTDNFCGNLFVSYYSFSDNIATEKSLHCSKHALFEDTKLRKLMHSSDEIWFASSWRYWQTKFIESSIENINKFIDKPVKVFGTKSFGKIRIKELIFLSQNERLMKINIVDDSAIETNAMMNRILGSGIFIDIQNLMCDAADVYSCNLFTRAGDLISYDGSHLTKYGAEFLGSKLVEINLLEK